MNLKQIVAASCMLMVALSTHSKQAPLQSPEAIALAEQAMAALGNTTRVSDITLNGTVTRTVGSDVESGSVVLKALGGSDSRMDLNFSNGTRQEVRNLSSTSGPHGYWVDLDGSTHSMAVHNCITDAAWFAPELTVLSELSNPNITVSYVGQENRAGASVQHLHFAFQSISRESTDPFPQLSAEEVYLDVSTFLPVAIVFNAHPDNDAETNILVEIDFSAYHPVSGVQVPFRIQKLVNNSLMLDLTINSAEINQGLTATDFS